MKQQIKKWTLFFTATALLIAGLLLVLVLNPILAYSNKTTHHQFTIFHNEQLDQTMLNRLDEATEHIKASEFYNPTLRLDICLNDGSKYPKLIRALRGPAFAWGFFDKVVMQGTANPKNNYVELNGYKWNFTQLLAHEMIHCLQFDKLGLWKSNPMADIPNWKWEGYAEYIARQASDQKDFSKNMERLTATDQNIWEVVFADSTITAREYYVYWTQVQYCMEVKGMSYGQLLQDTLQEQTIWQEMGSYLKRENE